MFLIFALGRPGILPVDDLGVRFSLRSHFALPNLPNTRLNRKIATFVK
jgi:3-methyladenine DNA glycosylase/8-oxoguanine DNA glycosylase